MSRVDHWLTVLGLIGEPPPSDLDAVLGQTPHGERVPLAGFPPAESECVPPSSRLWEQVEPDWACIGIRVTHRLEDPSRIALKLAAAAVERGVVPVILTPLAQSGFEPLGFRTERVYGATEADMLACETELARFWGMAIIIDAADVSALT